MTNKKKVFASVLAAILLTSTLSVPAFAWNQEDIVSSDETSITLLSKDPAADYIKFSYTEKETYYFGTRQTGYMAIVMKDADTAPDTEEMSAISSYLTATPASEFNFENIHYCWDSDTKVLIPSDWDLDCVYIMSSDVSYPEEALYQLSGVEAVYNIYADFKMDILDHSPANTFSIWLSVPAGTSFVMEQCSDLPYVVSSIEERETENTDTDTYSLTVETPGLKSCQGTVEMIKAFLEMNIITDVTVPYLIHLMTSSPTGNPSFVLVENPYAVSYGDIDGDGTVSVEDAVSVLTYYAQQSAGLEAKLTQAVDTEESAFLAADVDGDGQITVEDAVAILTYYAKKSAGLDAAW